VHSFAFEPPQTELARSVKERIEFRNRHFCRSAKSSLLSIRSPNPSRAFGENLAILRRLAELGPNNANALRSGDIWLPGSRQFRDFLA
jgi:hypothetical protein